MGTQSTAFIKVSLACGVEIVEMFVGKTNQVVEDLVADNARHLETLLARNRVDNHVPMDANEVLRVKNAVLILVQVLAAVTCQSYSTEGCLLRRASALSSQFRITRSFLGAVVAL